MRGIFVTLLILAVVALGAAYYRNWIVVETASRPGDDTSSVNITLDRGKAREDLREVRNQARELANKAQERIAGATTMEGDILFVDPVRSEVMLQVGEHTHIIKVDKDTTVMREDKPITLDNMKPGDKAVVRFKEDDTQKIAQSIVVKAG